MATMISGEMTLRSFINLENFEFNRHLEINLVCLRNFYTLKIDDLKYRPGQEFAKEEVLEEADLAACFPQERVSIPVVQGEAVVLLAVQNLQHAEAGEDIVFVRIRLSFKMLTYYFINISYYM
jgi:hypothetical protein